MYDNLDLYSIEFFKFKFALTFLDHFNFWKNHWTSVLDANIHSNLNLTLKLLFFNSLWSILFSSMLGIQSEILEMGK
jgi:hypothetical protein